MLIFFFSIFFQLNIEQRTKFVCNYTEHTKNVETYILELFNNNNKRSEARTQIYIFILMNARMQTTEEKKTIRENKNIEFFSWASIFGIPHEIALIAQITLEFFKFFFFQKENKLDQEKIENRKNMILLFKWKWD